MNNKPIKKYNIIALLTYISIFTCSFDIFGDIDIAGHTVRITQLVYIPVLIVGCLFILKKRRILFPVGCKILLVWICLQLYMIHRSPELNNAIGYFLWLLFDYLIIIVSNCLYNEYYSFYTIIRIYINSFVFVAIIGIIQFILSLFGIDFYVTQWWNKSLARINGFSFEPSYYATYLVMGFVVCSYLIINNNNSIFPVRKMIIKLITIIVALVLSSSRMGWLMMLLWMIVIINLKIYDFVRYGSTKKQLGHSLFFFIIELIVVVFCFFYTINNSYLLSGLGLMGSANHSSSERIRGLMICINIFKKSPLIGYSLGGVDPMIAQYIGIPYKLMSNGAGMSIVGELLVACGIVGIIPFLIFLFQLMFTKHSKNGICSAMIWGLIFEIAILTMNQNILRPYLWWHIAVLCITYDYDYKTMGN